MAEKRHVRCGQVVALVPPRAREAEPQYECPACGIVSWDQTTYDDARAAPAKADSRQGELLTHGADR